MSKPPPGSYHQSRKAVPTTADNGYPSHKYTGRPPLDSPHRGGDAVVASVPSATPSNGHDRHFVVAAIDFGTTYSGYAFSFIRDPDSIHMMRKWEGGDPGVSNQKTLTTLLLKPNGEFHSFGFSARDFYHDLEEHEARKWLYFEKFKMTLHSSQVSQSIIVFQPRIELILGRICHCPQFFHNPILCPVRVMCHIAYEPFALQYFVV